MSPPPSEPVATKRALRRSMRAAIAALDREERRQQEIALAAIFPGLPGWAGAATVLLYVSAFPEEIDTSSFLARAIDEGRRLVLPRVDRSAGCLRLHLVHDLRRDLAPGVLDIPEPMSSLPEIPPSEIEWALIPGLAFDERGYRLGRGAGHYDRLLPSIRPDAGAWAIGLDCQLVARLPVEPHDAPVDGVATPGRTVLGVRRSDRPRQS